MILRWAIMDDLTKKSRLCGFGEVIRLSDNREWEAQCQKVMTLKKFDFDTRKGRYAQDRVKLLKRAAIWCGSQSEQFTRNHKDRMLQAVGLWLVNTYPFLPAQ